MLGINVASSCYVPGAGSRVVSELRGDKQARDEQNVQGVELPDCRALLEVAWMVGDSGHGPPRQLAERRPLEDSPETWGGRI